ncbi:type II secretion system protein [uncultured Clostridium sp.]|uniref:type IV pilus modification PilV family protein n=1 Tax=uncultured Clostridium sp. TaxID=59620 RepID=UPI0028E1DA7A|nr:type II secretion system protein [uncultured Clostridium sp.]
MIKIKKYKSGFTLVEVIIAMVLIIGTVAIFSSVAYSSLKAGNKNKQGLEGTIIAQNYLELIKAKKENGEIKDLETLENYIMSLSFNISEGGYYKEDTKEGIKYGVYMKFILREDSEVGELVDILVEVHPQDSNSVVKLGTKIYIPDIEDEEQREGVEKNEAY